MSNSKVQTCNLRDNLGIWSFGKIRSTIFSFFIRDISSRYQLYYCDHCCFRYFYLFIPILSVFSWIQSTRIGETQQCLSMASIALTIFKYCRVECVGSSNVPEGRR